MCEISNSKIQRFQSWYFPDKPFNCFVFIFLSFIYIEFHEYANEIIFI